MIVVKVHCNGLLLLSPTAFIDHVTITPVSLTLFYVFFETLDACYSGSALLHTLFYFFL